jgi:phosphohistidine phosphatase
MKTLLILRHGKAESYNEDGDKARELAERGHRDAKRMGEVIREQVGAPDLVVSSDAIRARQTAVTAAAASGYKGAIEYRSEIYEASPRTLLAVVRSLPETATTVLLVGHNPGFEELASDLAEAPLDIGGLPTAGLVILRINAHWKAVGVGTAQFVDAFAPKRL